MGSKRYTDEFKIEAVRQVTDVFDYIEMFYSPKRRHGSDGDVSPVDYERRYAQQWS